MATLFKAPTSNYKSTTLDGAHDISQDTVDLTSATGFQYPGVIVVDREDANGEATPSSREVIHYTGITSNQLTGCTRGEENSTARSHLNGALVEAVFTVEQFNDLRDTVAAATDVGGTVLHVANATITGTGNIATLVAGTMHTLALTSVASIAELRVGGKSALDATYGAITTDTDGATITFDMDVTNKHTVTLEGNRTLAVSNVDVGQMFLLTLVQDGSGSRTVTWFETIKWAGGAAPVLTATATKSDSIALLCVSSNNYIGYVAGQNI